MYETPNKALAAARELGLGKEQFAQVSPGRWRSLLEAILEAFTVQGLANRHRGWLWEDFVEPSFSVQDKRLGLAALRGICPPDESVYLLLEDWDSTKREGEHWLFVGSFGHVLDVLDEMHYLEFYIVARDLSWLVSENHHAFQTAIGEPAMSALRAAHAV